MEATARELKAGDHIFVPRWRILFIGHFSGVRGRYQHQGIYVGDGWVVHYHKPDGRSKGAVERTSLSQFSKRSPISVRAYPPGQAGTAEDVVARAEKQVGQDCYDLLLHNCEHFAEWCKTGRHESIQADGYGGRFVVWGRERLASARQRFGWRPSS
jgi:cell wall-associated NlpC family hydrolase